MISAMEWLQIAVQATVLGTAVLIIRNAVARLEAKLETLANVLTGVRHDLKDCVTWDELSRELSPVRASRDDHERRIGVLETKCEARHGG